jgi:hypothetical protein
VGCDRYRCPPVLRTRPCRRHLRGPRPALQLWDLTTVLKGPKKAKKSSKGGAGAGAGAADAHPSLVKLDTTGACRAHDKDVNGLAVAPNDQLLASASQDKTIKVRLGSG